MFYTNETTKFWTKSIDSWISDFNKKNLHHIMSTESPDKKIDWKKLQVEFEKSGFECKICRQKHYRYLSVTLEKSEFEIFNTFKNWLSIECSELFLLKQIKSNSPQVVIYIAKQIKKNFKSLKSKVQLVANAEKVLIERKQQNAQAKKKIAIEYCQNILSSLKVENEWITISPYDINLFSTISKTEPYSLVVVNIKEPCYKISASIKSEQDFKNLKQKLKRCKKLYEEIKLVSSEEEIIKKKNNIIKILSALDTQPKEICFHSQIFIV